MPPGDVLRELAAEFLDLAEKRGATAPLMIGHRLMGMSLQHTGDIAQGRAHYDRGVALYDQTEHRPLASRFGQDIKVAILCYRSWAQWILGYPDVALADADCALKDAREIGQAATLMYALNVTSWFHMLCRDFVQVSAKANELIPLADEKGAKLWKALGVLNQGCSLVVTGKASDAVAKLTLGINAYSATGSTIWLPYYQSYLARALSGIGQFGDAWHQIVEAMTGMEKAKEKWCEAELKRVAGEIALMSPERDGARAEAYFESALAVARKQQAKSWELRAAMSLARLWRDQGKVQQARELLAPVYGWFTEGFDTRDLKEAKTLLEELAE
jgi:predicted ATPase